MDSSQQFRDDQEIRPASAVIQPLHGQQVRTGMQKVALLDLKIDRIKRHFVRPIDRSPGVPGVTKTDGISRVR